MIDPGLEYETLMEEARRRALAGDGCVAGLLAIVTDLQAELDRRNERLPGERDRTRHQDVWGYDG